MEKPPTNLRLVVGVEKTVWEAAFLSKFPSHYKTTISRGLDIYSFSSIVLVLRESWKRTSFKLFHFLCIFFFVNSSDLG